MIGPPNNGGPLGVLAVCFIALTAAALAADFLIVRGYPFWAGAEPGVAALAGLGAAAFAALCARVAQLLLSRPPREEEGGNAGDNA